MSASAQRNGQWADWDSVELSSCFELQNGVNFSAEQKGRGLLVVDVLNMYSDDLFVRTDRLYRVDIKVPEDRFLRPGDVLFVRSSVKESGVGWPAIFKGHEEPVTNCGFLIRARQTKPRFDPKFFVHYLRQDHVRTQMISRAGKVAITNINQERLGSLKIPLPPLAEQRRIAEVLDRAEALRAKRRAALAELDSLTQSLFLDLFGDPVTNPKKLPQVSLAEITTRITDGTHLTPKFVDSGVPFIFVKNVRNGSIDFHTDKFISEEEHAMLYKRCPVQEGDVLYTTVGATYGQAALVGSFTKFAFQRHLAHLKPDPTKVVPSFLGTTMQLPLMKKQADRWARGAAQPTINLKELREMVIPLPPITLQQEFARRVGAVEKLKQAQRAALAEQDALFAALQHRAFRGEL